MWILVWPWVMMVQSNDVYCFASRLTTYRALLHIPTRYIHRSCGRDLASPCTQQWTIPSPKDPENTRLTQPDTQVPDRLLPYMATWPWRHRRSCNSLGHLVRVQRYGWMCSKWSRNISSYYTILHEVQITQYWGRAAVEMCVDGTVHTVQCIALGNGTVLWRVLFWFCQRQEGSSEW